MSNPEDQLNPNLLFTSIFVKQLSSLEIEDVVLCAGSRSTPLTLAFTQSKKFRCYSQVDERSAAFFALGIAKVKHKPVVVVSTSGTAGANFYPAIIEAKANGIPLIILTADRPKELRISGANQTTDQIKLFGDHVNWFCDVVTPSNDPSPRLLRYMQTVALQAVEKSIYPSKGPVHVNFPFRKPLQPTNEEVGFDVDDFLQKSKFEYQPMRLAIGQVNPSENMITELNSLLSNSTFTLIIAGPNAYEDLSFDHLLKFSEKLNALVVADPLSGYRYQDIHYENLILGYETMLQFANNHLPPPDVILHLGAMPISKYLELWLEGLDYNKSIWVTINNNTQSSDSVMNSRVNYKVEPQLLITDLELSSIENKSNDVKLESWTEMNRIVEQRIEESMRKYLDFEPEILRSLFTNLPQSNLFIANSLMPRHLDQFVFASKSKLTIYSNRGVSGIDGTLSTALGLAVGSDLTTFLITGDLAFYHDLNGLLAMMRYSIPLNIFVINNGGGAIFDRLPISDYNPPFDEFFLTQHQLNFDRIAAQYNVKYEQLRFDDMKSFDQESYMKLLQEFVKANGMILEVIVPAERNEQIRIEILGYIQKMFK